MTPPLPSVLSNSALPKLAAILAKQKPCSLPHPPAPEARVIMRSDYMSVTSPRVTYQSLTSNLLLSFGDTQFPSLAFLLSLHFLGVLVPQKLS